MADGPPYARVHVPTALRARIAPGSAARVRIEGVEGEQVGRVRSISQDAAFTPYYALTKHDRGRLSYVAEIDLTADGARSLPSGLPVEVEFDSQASDEASGQAPADAPAHAAAGPTP